MSREPHDELFRTLLADPASADALVRRYAPPEFVARLTKARPRLLEGTLVRPGAGKLQADGILEVILTDADPKQAYVVFEHLSSPDPELPVRMHEYMTALWQRVHEPGRPRPLVIPVVLCQNRKAARSPVSLRERQTGAGGLAGVTGQLDFTLTLHDLTAIPPQELCEDPATGAALWALCLARVPDPPVSTLTAILRGLYTRPVTCLVHRKGVEYVKDVLPMSDTQMQAWTEMEQKGEAQDMAATTLAARLREQGRIEGVQQGRIEGVQQGRIEGVQQGRIEGVQQGQGKMLLGLLAERFGEVPGEVAERVRSAEIQDLEVWSRAILHSSDLDSVFRRPH